MQGQRDIVLANLPCLFVRLCLTPLLYKRIDLPSVPVNPRYTTIHVQLLLKNSYSSY